MNLSTVDLADSWTFVTTCGVRGLCGLCDLYLYKVGSDRVFDRVADFRTV